MTVKNDDKGLILQVEKHRHLYSFDPDGMLADAAPEREGNESASIQQRAKVVREKQYRERRKTDHRHKQTHSSEKPWGRALS